MSEPFEATLTKAITEVADGPLVTRWVVVAEVVTDDGERVLERWTSPDLASWDVIGMLDFHATFERKRIQTDLDDD